MNQTHTTIGKTKAKSTSNRRKSVFRKSVSFEKPEKYINKDQNIIHSEMNMDETIMWDSLLTRVIRKGEKSNSIGEKRIQDWYTLLDIVIEKAEESSYN